jgi:hypothetical protein
VPGDERDVVACQLASERHRLLDITGIITHDQLDRLPEHAPLGVEIRDRQLGTALILLAEPGIGAGHVAGDGDPDVGPCGRRTECRDYNQADDEQSRADHGRTSEVDKYCEPWVRPAQCEHGPFDGLRAHSLAELCSSGM